MNAARLTVILALLPVACASGGGPAAPPKTDILILPDGGTVKQQGDRVDVFDARSNRTGYGRIGPGGTVDIFNLDGSRRATITPGIGGRPARVTMPGKR